MPIEIRELPIKVTVREAAEAAAMQDLLRSVAMASADEPAPPEPRPDTPDLAPIDAGGAPTEPGPSIGDDWAFW